MPPKHSKKASKKSSLLSILIDPQWIDSLKSKLLASVEYKIINFDLFHPHETPDSKQALIKNNETLKENLISLLDNIKDNWGLFRDKEKEKFYNSMQKLIKMTSLSDIYDALLQRNYIEEITAFTKLLDKRKKSTSISTQTSFHPSQQQEVVYALKRMFQEMERYSTQTNTKQLTPSFIQLFLERSFFEMKYTLKLASDAIFNFNNYLKTEKNINMSEKLKSFLLTLTNLWTPTLRNNYEKMDKSDNTNEQTRNILIVLYYCAFIILDRISKILFRIHTKQEQDQFFQVVHTENIIEHVETNLNKIQFPKRKQQSRSTRFPLLRQKLYKRSLSRKEDEENPPTQQQIKQWQQRYDVFFKQLQKEQQTSKPSLSPLPPLPSHSQQQQKKQQQTLQRKQQPTQPHKMDYSFFLPSPYTHRDDPRFTQQQNRKLQQRKKNNRGTVQKSLTDQSIPEKIMRMAVDGNYTCILLIDASNQREKLSMPLEKLLPMEIPPSFQKKPLFVLIDQGDLDSTGSAKVVFKRNKKGARNIIYLHVSCAKERQDGTITDCFKKLSDHDFTKNPMDDFVLLTLRHVLRSIYYKNMHNERKVSKLKQLQELVAQNPYSLLQNQQEIAFLLQPIVNTYDKTLNTIPYTWSVSNDRFRDWKKE